MRRWKGKIAQICMISLLFVSVIGFYIPNAFAAKAIETDKACSISWSTTDIKFENDSENAFVEQSIPVKLYRVAEVSNVGEFTSCDEFKDIDVQSVAAKNENATAAEWLELATEAAEIAKTVTPTVEKEITKGALEITDLQTGMYLVTVDPIYTSDYKYTFAPYLVSLPDNNYYRTTENQSDEWIYDVVSSLKTEQEPRFGDLVISKTLDTYQSVLGKTTFVFQVEGTKDNFTYSNVVSLTFDQAGTQSVTIPHLPAGMEVTVTEVYSGASYEATTDSTNTVAIIAEPFEETDEVVPMAEVDFSNTYNDKLIGGYGVTNHFAYDENADEWQWSQLEDSRVIVQE